MKRRLFVSMSTLAVTMAVTSLAPAPAAAGQAGAGAVYVAPRTPDGQPDLQGVWANNDATPLERPKEFQGRARLTPGEVAMLKKRAGDLFNGETDAAFGDSVYLAVIKDAKDFKSTDTQTGNYNHFWIVDREFDDRTSLVVDPQDGRIPALTDAAKRQLVDAAEYRKQHPADGPEDLPLTHRCITFSVPRISAGYNSYYQIVQARDYVAIWQETIHDYRIIPLDGRPHVSDGVRQWIGDARGHWEGDTLVVETKNFSGKSRFQNLSSRDAVFTERYTRVGPGTIQWDVTVNAPASYVKPWTYSVLLRSSKDQIYEMACHEGNEGLAGALSGTRYLEAAAEVAAKKGSN